MSNKQKQTDSPLDPLTSDSARQRWDLFHRAISYAKKSNSSAMMEADRDAPETESSPPALTIVK